MLTDYHKLMAYCKPLANALHRARAIRRLKQDKVCAMTGIATHVFSKTERNQQPYLRGEVELIAAAMDFDLKKHFPDYAEKLPDFRVCKPRVYEKSPIRNNRKGPTPPPPEPPERAMNQEPVPPEPKTGTQLHPDMLKEIERTRQALHLMFPLFDSVDPMAFCFAVGKYYIDVVRRYTDDDVQMMNDFFFSFTRFYGKTMNDLLKQQEEAVHG